MRSFGAVLLPMLLAATTSAAHAQGTPPPARAPQGAPAAGGQVRGIVHDAESGKPLPSASVALWSVADSSLITGALTRPDGNFLIDGVRPGRYYLKVSYLGYTTGTTDNVVLTAAAPQADVGAIRLTTAAVQLEGVTVTAERSQATFAPDRNTYQVKDMPAAAGGTATDVLRNIPAVEVDGDGKVSLRGNQNVVVQINGRAAPMRGEQLAAFLQQLPANMVDKVEVVPNPSAKFDPDGMAGIINIALRQDADLGKSGGLTLGGGSYNRKNASGNLGYQRGPLTLYGSYGYFSTDRRSDGSNYRENRYLVPHTFLQQETSGRGDMGSHNVNTSAELKLSKKDVLSSSFMFSKYDFGNGTNNHYLDLDAGRNPTARSRRLSDVRNDDQTLDYTLNFKRTFEGPKHEWSTDLRFNRNRDDAANGFTQRPLALDGTETADRPALESQDQDVLTRSLTFQSDYSRPLGAASHLEIGYKGIVRWMDSDLAVATFDHDQTRYLPDLSRSNAFEYDEQVHAIYGVLNHRLGAFDLQGGLRLEQALTQFHLATSGEQYDNDYFSLFPSGLVAYNLTDTKQLKASYSRRIWRPHTSMLNPFATYEDPLNLFRGNPYLKPEYTHALELGYQQSGRLGSLQLTPFFRRTTGAMRTLKTIDEDGVSTVTFQNLATSDSWGGDVNGSFRLGKVNGFAGFSAYRTVTDGSNVEEGLSNDAFSWSARVSGTWRVTPRLDAQGFYMYRAPMKVERGRISGMSMVNFSVRQKLIGDKGNVTLRVVDPFNQMKYNFITSDDRHYQESIRYFNQRGVYLSFGLNVGQAPRIRARAQEPDQAAPDVGIR